jgi:hypothetical protein
MVWSLFSIPIVVGIGPENIWYSIAGAGED